MPIFLGKYIANPNKNCIRRHYSFIGIRYVAPTIINTFLESYDLSGKTIIPFATSGGSGMGKTNEKLKPSCPNSTLLEGRVFKARVTKAELAAWEDGIVF